MADKGVESDIAFIRQAIEGGRAYARGRSPDLLVWGLFVATGYFATYAFLRHWIALAPGWIWLICIVVPWLFSLRRLGARLIGQGDRIPPRSPMGFAMAMLWLGCGIFLTSLSFAEHWSGTIGPDSFDAIVAGVLGIAFFAGSTLCNLPWMRWVAIAWWLAEFALFTLHDEPERLLVSAALMLVLLAGPGLVLFLGRTNAA